MSGIGAGANVVGGIIQSVAAGLAGKEMANQFRKEQERQQAHSARATGYWQPGTIQKGAEEANRDLGESSLQRQNAYNQIGDTQLGVTQAPNARMAANARLMGQNRAQVGAYSDWTLHQLVKNLLLQDKLNQITNFAAGDASVFPARMDAAQHSWDELAFWGSLVSSLGGGGGSFDQLGKANPQSGPRGISGGGGGNQQFFSETSTPFEGE